MVNPLSWSKLKAPPQWGRLPDNVNFYEVLTARDNREIQLMIDFDCKIWWRRDFCEGWDLGL
jgi:hypothetical protein